MNRFIKNWILVIAWMGVIFFLSHQPSLHSGLDNWLDFILRKIAHITEYAILCFLLIRALGESHISSQNQQNDSLNNLQAVKKWLFKIKPKKEIIIICLLFSLLYAVSDEYHQTFVFGRHGTLRDVIIDSVGIFLVSAVFWRRKIENKKSP